MSVKPDEIFDCIRAWRRAGKDVALATVVRTWGSSPRPVGSHLAVDDAGAFVGSVSGGCIEGAVIQEALAAISDGKPRLMEFGVSDEQAWEVGLACGGRVQVYVDRIVPGLFERVAAACDARRAGAWVTRLADGRQALVEGEVVSGDLTLTRENLDEIRSRVAADRSGPLDGDQSLFARIYATPARLIVVGAVHISQALAPMAAAAGFEVTIVDPRRAFATAERFPGVTLVDEWPDEAMARLAPDRYSAVVTLTHDPKLDDPALRIALLSPAFYIGALGSSRTHAKRVARLTEQGVGHLVDKIHAPVGLDLGGRSPAELAVSVLAEVIRVRYKEAAA
jgi:xanthine dehydrogenase accessory factor